MPEFNQREMTNLLGIKSEEIGVKLCTTMYRNHSILRDATLHILDRCVQSDSY